MSSESSKCPYNKHCGGCQYIDMPYERQLSLKKKEVSDLLRPFVKVTSIYGMDDPYYYRNKVTAAFDHDKRGNAISGIYEEKSHNVIPIDHCFLENQKADEIIVTIRNMLKSFKIKTYDEKNGYGLIRHVMVRTGTKSGEIMVVIVVVSPIFPSKNNFVKALREKHPEISTIVLNINDKDTTMVLGERNIVLYGKGYINDTLGGIHFTISPNSFYQINAKQTEVLYEKAMEFAGLTGKETVFDAYCGIGTISLYAALRCKNVIGVELNRTAVKDAIGNAKRNECKNATFFCGDAGTFLENYVAQGNSVDVLFMDPPRSGSSEQFLRAVIAASPKKVIYVSCNPETLARDLKFLKQHGFCAEQACAVDMFPMTNNVETVCLLSKLHSEHHIEVELNLDEMDLTASESKATYEEIKAWVLEHSGLRVSSLYIAQVKQKCGIIERKNYNKAKIQDATQPQCPPGKETAIVDALKHFGMLPD